MTKRSHHGNGKNTTRIITGRQQIVGLIFANNLSLSSTNRIT
ncbi:Uncharacterised protein [Sphingobacterium spiritivorum]|uniref:Uncharacterized protein n=1 Tax=Sphingobacterium spiritivorum TaxID=258 RepID=A0A380CXK3_SPHSI|nr:Uncharacterised protein [Sphingobacterium spiritivorum]